jgi:glycosyltransferase involved in cell wall biosynthesis
MHAVNSPVRNPSEAAVQRPTLMVFADDWGRHPSSAQHLIRHLLDQYSVIWVNTIGMRKPRLDWATLTRAMEKFGHWLLRPKTEAAALPPNLRVMNPRMWPSFGSRLGRRLNRWLLGRQLAPVIRALPSPTVAVTALPIVADLMGVLPVQRWVYYCVDDFGQWPGLDQVTLQQMEEPLVRSADMVIACSTNLQARLGRTRRPALLTHGVELDFWRPSQPAPLPQIEGLERPLVVFFGSVDWRLDAKFVDRLARDMAQGTIVLVGPELNPDPALDRVPRMVRLGPLPYEQVPALAQAASVLVMPYVDTAGTRALQPLKLKEYLATGKPTVVRDLPANREWADCLDLAATPEVFSAAVRRRIAEGVPQEQREARARLREESWARKAQQFERLILGQELQAAS